VVSDCPEYFGRYNKIGGGSVMLNWMSVRNEDVAGPLAEKRFVSHVPAPVPAPGLRTGVLQREIRAVYSGVRGLDDHES
ncbi:MAG: hypothetical protein QGD89_11160, partial [Actinomycetota bacterium]|nr:hypothetical protein [Actinomycetota bacterium]